MCWLGGWQKHRMLYLVMLVKLKPRLSIGPVPAQAPLAPPKDEALKKSKKNKRAPPAMKARWRFVLQTD
jgi:hypothetical protein